MTKKRQARIDRFVVNDLYTNEFLFSCLDEEDLKRSLEEDWEANSFVDRRPQVGYAIYTLHSVKTPVPPPPPTPRPQVTFLDVTKEYIS